MELSKNSKHVVSKSNFLNEASYHPTLNQQRVILSAVAKMNPLAEKGDNSEYIKITVNEYAKQFDIARATAYRDLKDATIGLWRLEIIEKKGTRAHYKRWVTEVTVDDGKGWISLKFSDYVKPHLEALKKRFTSYQLRHISGFKKVSSIRLYELCQQWNKSSGDFFISVSDLKKSLGVADKYPRWADLNRRIIKPAITEINLKSDIEIEMKTAKKKGTQKIERLWFIITPKTQTELDL